MIPQKDLLARLVDFVVDYFPAYRNHRDGIGRLIALHMKYGTFDYISENGEIIACVRWNIEDNGKTAHILDLVIHPKYRGSVLLPKRLIARNWIRFPWVRQLRFGRGQKYSERPTKVYDLFKLMKRRKQC